MGAEAVRDQNELYKSTPADLEKVDAEDVSMTNAILELDAIDSGDTNSIDISSMGNFSQDGFQFNEGVEKTDENGKYIEIGGKKYYEYRQGMTGLGYENNVGRIYIGDIVDGIFEGRGTRIRADGRKYEGDFVNDSKTGQGTMTWPNGEKYKGDFVDGKKEGQGTYTWANGAKYEGDWKNDKIEGKGTMTRSTGEKYEGDFVDGKIEGKGTKTWPSGAKYEGAWKNSIRHGTGTMTRANGAKYEGTWKNDTRDGTGTMTRADGDKYEGDFVDGRRTGQGTYTWANGAIYKGEFKENKMIQGEYILNEGESIQSYQVERKYNSVKGYNSLKIIGEDKYINMDTGEIFDGPDTVLDGQWHIDEGGRIVFDNGTEIHTDKNGKYIEIGGKKYYEYREGMTGLGYQHGINGDNIGRLYLGDYVDGKSEGKGTMSWANGAKYEGDYVDGKSEGKGTMSWANGAKYEGDFVDGESTGEGTMTWINGDKYEGDFVDGRRTGQGTYTWANGAIFKGEFKDGDMIKGEYIVKKGESTQHYPVERKGDLLMMVEEGKYINPDTGEIYDEPDTATDGEQQVDEKGSTSSIDSAETQTDQNGKYIEIGGQKYYEYREGMTGFGYKNGVYEYYDREGTYFGEYVNGKEEGKGIYAWRDGTQYAGDWENGMFEGKGRYTWKNGTEYDGDFVGGIRQGEGTMTWSNGNKYIGKFEKDVMTSGTIYIKSENKQYTVVRDGERRLQITDGPDNIGKYIDQTNGGIYIDGNGSPKTREYMPMEGGSIMIDGED